MERPERYLQGGKIVSAAFEKFYNKQNVAVRLFIFLPKTAVLRHFKNN